MSRTFIPSENCWWWELHDRMKQNWPWLSKKAMNEQQSKLAQKDQEIAQLQSQVKNFDTEERVS